MLGADTSTDAAVWPYFSCPRIRWSLAFKYCLYFLFVFCPRSDLMVQTCKTSLDGCRRRMRFKLVAVPLSLAGCVESIVVGGRGGRRGLYRAVFMHGLSVAI